MLNLESDINPIFRCLSSQYKNCDTPFPNIGFFEDLVKSMTTHRYVLQYMKILYPHDFDYDKDEQKLWQKIEHGEETGYEKYQRNDLFI